MSLISRWHHSSCRTPDIIVSGSLPYCQNCSSLPDLHYATESIDLPARKPPQIPTLERRDMLQLSWPACISYELETISSESAQETKSTETLKVSSEASSSPSSGLNTHIYETLATSDEIRVLQLSGGNTESPVHGVLRKHRLKDFAAYEALSYTWESHDDDQQLPHNLETEVIYLGPYWDVFLVPKNCLVALRRLRFADRIRELWVDSICINQDSPDERVHQVGLMQKIFENALSVIAYLGSGSADSSLALQALRQPDCLEQATSIESSAVAALFQRPYFSRLWVAQEVTSAKSLHFICGDSEAFFNSSFASAFEPVSSQKYVPAWLRYSCRHHSTGSSDLFSLLIATASCRCSDPRDKVFGLIGIVEPGTEQRLTPDYTLSVEQVYTGTAAFCIEKHGVIPILELAAISSSTNQFPTWVPDWNNLNNGESCSSFWEDIGPVKSEESPNRSQLPLRNQTIADVSASAEPSISLRLSTNYHTPYHQRPQVSITGGLSVCGLLIDSDGFNIRHRWRIGLFKLGLSNLGYRKYLSRIASVVEWAVPERQASQGSHVLLMAPSYCHALLLDAAPEKKGFVLKNVGETLQENPDLPKYLAFHHCLLPLTSDEIAIRTRIISREVDFPLLQEFDFFHDADMLILPETFTRSSEALLTLLSPGLCVHQSKEAELWRQWQTLERECMPMLSHQETMDYLSLSLDSLRASNVYVESNPVVPLAGRSCFAEFLSLLILDPFSKPDLPDQSGIDKKHPKDNCDLSRSLNCFQDWAKITTELLRHTDEHGEEALDHSLHPVTSHLPGGLSMRAAKVCGYHMKVADIVGRGKKAWRGWHSSFTLTRIARQRLQNRDIGVEVGSRSRHTNEAYWDWNVFKETMSNRAILWGELMRFRNQLMTESKDVDLQLALAKGYVKATMKGAGYDLDSKATSEQRITIV